MSPGPWTFDLHLGWWLVLAAAAVGYGLLVRRPGYRVSAGQAAAFLGGLGVLALALTWPLADLAAHWSLVALVLQRLLLLLAAPPLLVLGLPVRAVVLGTRPPPLDEIVRQCGRPVVAVVVVTVVAVGTLTTPAVAAQGASPWAAALLESLLLAAGMVLWMPVLPAFPGTHRPGAVGRAAYLIVQSVVPAFLSFVWILARHPLYASYAHVRSPFGLSPLVDQQLAGFVAKIGTIAVLWVVAFLTIRHADQGAETDEATPLTWADVERDFERADRRRRRSPWLPPRAEAAPPPGPRAAAGPDDAEPEARP